MNIFEIIKAKPVQNYEKTITPLLDNLWNKYSFEAIDESIKAVAKGEPFLQPFTDAAEKVGDKAKSEIKAKTRAIWTQKNRVEVVKKDVMFSFNKPNEKAIEALTSGQLAWIKDHGNQSEIATAISNAYGRLWGEGKTRPEIVKALQDEFGKYTPVKYTEMFGEKKYWEMFAQHHSVLSSSFASINTFEKGGKYKWWARNTERTCEICGGLHNQVFDNDAAIEQKNSYIKAASTGDIEAMKIARPFTPDPKNANNPTVPAHIGCMCRLLEIVSLEEFKTRS